MELRFSRHSGKEVAAIIPELGKLRIAVFYEYPYLYEGSMEYEEEYLQTYIDSPESLVFMVWDGDKAVGATTCVPLIAEMQELIEPFARAGFNLSKVMYFGESILLPEYRGIGLGHRFFDEREAFTQSLGGYSITTFCAVDRPEDHPMRPKRYKGNYDFWQTRGYIRHPELQCRFAWLDRDEMYETKKTLTFYIKEWK